MNLSNHFDATHTPAMPLSAVTRRGSDVELQVPLPERGDCAVIELSCDPLHYSASLIARAVEDAGVALTDLLTAPSGGTSIAITIRVRTHNTSAVCASLERYGFQITNVYSHSDTTTDTALERLALLEAYLKV